MPAERALQRHEATQALVIAIVLTLAVHWLPLLQPVAQPLLMVSTLVHELGHGLCALLLGGQFTKLIIWPDGSGVAGYSGRFGAIEQALIAAAGLLGPPLAALGLFVAGRASKPAHWALACCAVVLLATAVLWAASWYTLLYCLGLALALLLLAWKASAVVSQIVTVFVAVQLALSSFTRADYLFTATANTGAGEFPSDVAQIAQALILPYWFWGGLIALLTVALLALGIWLFAKALG